MTRQEILDLYFMEARSKLLEVAAFMDRVDRESGAEDFRMKEFRKALGELGRELNNDRILRLLNDDGRLFWRQVSSENGRAVACKGSADQEQTGNLLHHEISFIGSERNKRQSQSLVELRLGY